MSMTNLPFIQQEMIRYGMTAYLVIGLVGNICNCIMFTHHSQQRTASSIYFLFMSIFAIVYLIWSVAPLIHTLNYTDLQIESVFYCKVRLYVSHSLGQCLRYFVVFASADRFFVTQINTGTRVFSSVSMAIKFVFIISVVCFLIAIHIPILINIRNHVCGMIGLYKLIYAFYQIILIGILPPVLMSIFSILTICNLYQRHRSQRRLRKRDRCLIRMVLAEVLVNIFISIPYSINLVYQALTYYVVDKSAKRLEIEAFITFVTQFLIYLISVVPFYLFLLTSKLFRKRFINIATKFWKKHIIKQIRIVPSNVQPNTAIINRSITRNTQQQSTF